MPSLLDLPTELLVEIVQNTIPVDFEATALSCKTLFAASAPFLARYTTRRARYRNFVFSSPVEGKDRPEGADEDGSPQTGTCIRTTRGLLEKIAIDPSIAHYIQSIDLSGHEDEEEEEDDEDDEEQQSRAPEVPETLRNLVLTSPFIKDDAGDPEEWIEGIQNSTVDADIFLLTLLPQLRTMALRLCWDEVDHAYSLSGPDSARRWPVLKKITHQANRPREFADAPLSKLSALRPFLDSDYEEKCALTPLTPFLVINSVSQVSLSSCILLDDGYTGSAFESIFKCYSTNLRKLSLNSSVAGKEELSRLLSLIPNLEILEFSHQTKWHGCGYWWNFGAFLYTVQNICHKTLKELSLTYTDPVSENPAGATLMDMTRFEKLAVLSLSAEMLCGPPYDPSKGDLESDGEEARKAFGSPGWPRLIEMLPASIEKFNLHVCGYEDEDLKCISHLVRGLVRFRATRLPRLNQLTLFVHTDRLEETPTPKDALKVLRLAKDSGFSVLDSVTSKPLV